MKARLFRTKSARLQVEQLEQRELLSVAVAPGISAGPLQTVYLGSTVAFQGFAADPMDVASIDWDFDYDGATFTPDPSASGTLTPTHVFSSAGIYPVALSVVDGNGDVSQNVSAAVVKAQGSLIVDAGSFQDVAPSTTVAFGGSFNDGNGQVSASGIEWDFNYDGQNFQTDVTGTLTPAHVYTDPGVYRAALRVTDSLGVSEVSVVITAVTANYDGPTAAAGSDQSVARNSVVTFAGSATDPDGFLAASGIAWDFDYDGSNFQADTTSSLAPTWTFAKAGTHVVALQVTDNHGMSSLSEMLVTVDPLTLTLDAGADQVIHVGDTASFTGSFTNNEQGPVDIGWDFAYDGSTFHPGSADSLTPVHTFSQPGTYTVALLITNVDGDSGFGTLEVTVLNSSVLVVDAGPDQFADQASAVTFSGSYVAPGTTVDPANIDWDFNYDGTTFQPDSEAHSTLTPSHAYLVPGTYLVGLQITDSAGNTRTGTSYVAVLNAPPTPRADEFVFGSEGETVSFHGTVTDVSGPDVPLDVQWDFDYDGQNFHADPSASGVLTPSHVYSRIGEYLVALKVTDPWGGVGETTLRASIGDTAPTATVTASGLAPEGSAVTLTVTNLTDSDPTANFRYLADWNGTRVFEEIQASDLVNNPDGSITPPSYRTFIRASLVIVGSWPLLSA